MLVENLDLNVSCKIDQFRYFSKINGLSLLDGTYLERLISYFFKGQNLILSKIVVELKDLKVVLEVFFPYLQYVLKRQPILVLSHLLRMSLESGIRGVKN